MIRDYSEFDATNPVGLWRNSHYQPDKNALSVSSAKVLLGQRPPKASGALEFGNLAHTVLLEPDHLESRYAVLDPKVVGVKADGSVADNPTATKAWRDAVTEAESNGLTVILPDDWEKAHALAEAVRDHPTAGQLVGAATERELLAYAEHESGAMLRGKLDLLGPDFAADLKTTFDGDPEGFGHLAWKRGLHMQAAAYIHLARANGYDVERFSFINVEKEPTLRGKYRASVTYLTEEALALGREQLAEACDRWLELGRVVDLPDYPDEAVEVDLPTWVYRNHATATEAGISADFEWSAYDYA